MSMLLMVAIDWPVELRTSRLGDLGGRAVLEGAFFVPLQGLWWLEWFSAICQI